MTTTHAPLHSGTAGLMLRRKSLNPGQVRAKGGKAVLHRRARRAENRQWMAEARPYLTRAL